MKLLQILPIAVLLMTMGAADVLAASTPERTRATITRSVESPQTDRETRGRETASEESEDDSAGDSTGTVLIVTSDSGGKLDINYEANDDSGGADIKVTINGKVVSNTGQQDQDEPATSEGGSDGEDGESGTEEDDGSDSESDTEPEDEQEEEDRNERPNRDRDTRQLSR